MTDSKGEPVVGTRVNLVRVRTLEGRAVREVNRSMMPLERRTDDRGVFRRYGLRPGVYVVSAGGRFSTPGYTPTPHAGEAPTFYPSATRDNATESTLRAGEEAAGVDIRLRHEEGRTVSGTVEGDATGSSRAPRRPRTKARRTLRPSCPTPSALGSDAKRRPPPTPSPSRPVRA